MTDTAADPGTTAARRPRRRLLSSVPLWARVSGIIVVILTGVLLSSMLLGVFAGEGQAGGHGSGGQMQVTHQGGSGSSHGGRSNSSPNHGSGGSHDARGDHGPGGSR